MDKRILLIVAILAALVVIAALYEMLNRPGPVPDQLNFTHSTPFPKTIDGYSFQYAQDAYNSNVVFGSSQVTFKAVSLIDVFYNRTSTSSSFLPGADAIFLTQATFANRSETLSAYNNLLSTDRAQYENSTTVNNLTIFINSTTQAYTAVADKADIICSVSYFGTHNYTTPIEDGMLACLNTS